LVSLRRGGRERIIGKLVLDKCIGIVGKGALIRGLSGRCGCVGSIGTGENFSKPGIRGEMCQLGMEIRRREA